MSKRVALLAGIGVLVAAGVAGGAIAFTRGGGTSNRIVVTDSGCATHWSAPGSGRTIFTIANESPSTVYKVQLVGTSRSAVYGQVEMVAPSTEVPLDVVLPPGRYAFQCEGGDGYTLLSPAKQVTGPPVAGAHPFVQVTGNQIEIAMATYRTDLVPLMERLAAQTGRLTAAVRAGRLASARRLWLPAHLEYARLGAAYDTFGKFNDEIDGRPLGLVGGVHNPSFQGFLRLEYGLWHGQSAKELTPVAVALDRAVRGLVLQFPQLAMPQGDLALRAHEILENTLQFELTGETDEGSHTNLATAWANVQGTELTLAALTPVLRRSDPQLLASVTSGLRKLGSMLQSYERPDGRWVALQSLSTTQREHLDSALGGLLENLELIPDRLEPSSPPGGDDG